MIFKSSSDAFIQVTSHQLHCWQQLEQCCGHIVKTQNNSNYARRQKSPRHPSCEPNTAICLEDDMGNENHLLLDSINSAGVWRLQGSELCSSLWSTWKTFVARHAERDAEFPAIPRCSHADVLSGVFQRKSSSLARTVLILLTHPRKRVLLGTRQKIDKEK